MKYKAILEVNDDLVTVANARRIRHLNGTKILTIAIGPGIYYLATEPTKGYKHIATLTYHANELADYEVRGVELTFCALGVRRIFGSVPSDIYIRKSHASTHKWLER